VRKIEESKTQEDYRIGIPANLTSVRNYLKNSPPENFCPRQIVPVENSTCRKFAPLTRKIYAYFPKANTTCKQWTHFVTLRPFPRGCAGGRLSIL